MTTNKAKAAAIIATIVILSMLGLGFALIKSPDNGATSSTQPLPSPTATDPATTNPTAASLPTPTSTPAASPSTAPTQTQETATNGNFKLTITIEKTVYTVGEPVNMTLAITNISDQAVDFTSTAMNFDFIVSNGTGNQIYQWSAGQVFPMIATLKPLAPGESITESYVWQQTYSSPPDTSVPPGIYYIVAKSNQMYGLVTAALQILIVNP